MNAIPLSCKAEGWCAALTLRLAPRGARTQLIERAHVGPLVVQRPFYPEGEVCHVYLVHPPGGIVGGDELSLQVAVERGAHALVTTPAATKLYRSEGALAVVRQALEVEEAALEWLPQENIYFKAARVRSATTVALRGGARFIGWEITCLGRPAGGEAFGEGMLRLGFELAVDGQPRVVDRLRIDGDNAARAAVWGLSSCTAIGTLLAYPADGALRESVRSEGHDMAVACSIVDEVLVCRVLGAQAEPVKQALTRIWQRIRPVLLGREAALPRIWQT